MKILTLVARILLGLAFVIFGLNGFLQFLPMGPMPAGPAQQFMQAMAMTHYFVPIFLLEILSGILLLFNRYVPLGLTFLCPILVNILFFHAFMAPRGVLPGLLCAICWIIVYWSVRPAFRGILQQKPSF